MLLLPSLLAIWLAHLSSPTIAATAGTFADGGSTLVSAMMMFLGNTEKVYILDKAEGNAAQVNGHPAWGAVWDIATRQATVMDVASNVFCASGMHLPNGSYVAFGGNSAVGRGGETGSAGNWDAEYQDFDGSRAIRVLNPCTSEDDFASTQCQWFDNAAVLSMQKKRWYSTAEALADGSIVLIGGFVGGGYINRNTPDTTPVPEAAENSFEFYPANGRGVTVMQFLFVTRHWYMDNLFIGALEHNAESALMWNIALDGSGNPKYPGTSSCGGPGCRPLATINSDGSYSLNQEFYAMAQASKAVYPKDAGGPYGQRIAVSVEGNLNWALRVGAFVTGRVSSSDWLRYSLVVLNWDDSASTSWNPVPVSATIAFRGAQASYTFPVGVTTLWWFAPATSATSAFIDGTTFAYIDDVLGFSANTTHPNATTAAANITLGE